MVVTEFPMRSTIPGANLGEVLFGGGVLGAICDFFNPLSDIQDFGDLMRALEARELQENLKVWENYHIPKG